MWILGRDRPVNSFDEEHPPDYACPRAATPPTSAVQKSHQLSRSCAASGEGTKDGRGHAHQACLQPLQP